MRQVARAGFLTLALVIPLALVGVQRCADGERPVAEYATRAEADAAGAFTRGWLPAFLPASARALREVHDLDTNERWLRFDADSAELAALVTRLAPLTLADARRTLARRPAAAGADWPPEFAARPLATPRATTFLGLYRDDAAAYCLAIEWRTGRAWGWSCARAG